MIRYTWDQRDGRNLYTDETFKTHVPVLRDPRNTIFVNILEVKEDAHRCCKRYRVRLYYANGTTIEGWHTDTMMCIQIMNHDELFDGRFNV